MSRQLGWADLTNGVLLRAAEEAGFDALLTVDKSVRNQQNLSTRKVSLITLRSRSILLEDLLPFLGDLESALAELEEGGQTGKDIVLFSPHENP